MATGTDVRDILELSGGDNDAPISKKDFLNSDKVRGRLMASDAWLSWLSVCSTKQWRTSKSRSQQERFIFIFFVSISWEGHFEHMWILGAHVCPSLYTVYYNYVLGDKKPPLWLGVLKKSLIESLTPKL